MTPKRQTPRGRSLAPGGVGAGGTTSRMEADASTTGRQCTSSRHDENENARLRTGVGCTFELNGLRQYRGKRIPGCLLDNLDHETPPMKRTRSDSINAAETLPAMLSKFQSEKLIDTQMGLVSNKSVKLASRPHKLFTDSTRCGGS